MTTNGGDDAEEGGRHRAEESGGDTVSLSLDETLELLANRERREVVGYLVTASDGTATVDELVDHLVSNWATRTEQRPGRGHVTTTLHHVHLPKLADAGVADYDPRSNEVRYRSSDRLEVWYERIADREER